MKYLGLEHIAEGGKILEAASVENGELRSTKFGFSSAHVLYGKLRPYLAKIALPGFAGVCSTEIVPIHPGRDLDRKFLAYFLRQPNMVALATARSTGANLPRLSPKELAKFEIPLPPLAEQRRIAAILDQADALRAKRREALARLDEMAQAIFVEMFLEPEHKGAVWPRSSVESVASVMHTGPFGSQLLHSEFVDKGVAVLGIDNAVSNQFAWGERRFITKEKYRAFSRYRAYPNDVIITIMGTCGRVAIVPDDIPLAITTKHLCCITLDQELCIPEFLHACLLRHPDVLRQLGAAAKGAVMPGLNMGIIKSARFPLPPISLQAEFVKRFQSVAGMAVQNNKALRLSDSLFSSLQNRAFLGEL